MRWYGLSEGAAGGGAMRGPAPPAVLARGGLVLELALAGEVSGPAVLLHYARRSAWPGSLRIGLRGDGALIVTQSQQEREAGIILPGAVDAETRALRIGYGWDAPAGRAVLTAERLAASAEDVGSPAVLAAEGVQPLPLFAEDAEAIVFSAGPTDRHPGTAWLGLAEALPEAGRPVGVAATTLILTPAGARPAGALRAGDAVLTAEGALPLAAAATSEQPMLGALAPVRLRAPYFGRRGDLVVAPGQRVVLAGIEPEYLFGEEEVLVEARHLTDGRTGLRDRRAATMATVRLALHRPGLILADGLAVEAEAPGPAPCPVLRPHEAVALMAMREPGRPRRAG